MNNTTKKQELNKTEREQFLLQFLLFKKRCSYKEIKAEYDKKEITFRGRIITGNTIYNDVNDLVNFNLARKIGSAPFKLVCSDAIRDIKDLFKNRNFIEYNELINIDFYVNNLKEIVDTLFDVKMLEKDRDSSNKLIVKLRKMDTNY